MKSISLFYKDSGSDKEYNVQLVEKGEGYVVLFQYGRRGNALQVGTKTSTPVTLAEAEKIYAKLVKEKTGKGYSEGDVKKNEFSEVDTSTEKTVILLPQLLNAIDEIDTYVVDSQMIAQEKKDGQRRLVIKEGKKVVGINKKGCAVQLPLSITDSIKADCILDGEIIGDKLFVFDILSLRGKDLKTSPLFDRLLNFNYIKFGDAIEVVETAYTQAEKQKMFEGLKEKNAEGIVFKNKKASYVSGRPSSGGNQLKYKFYSTATFIVEGTTDGKRSVGLLMVDGDKKRFMGKCTIPPNYDIPKEGAFVEVRYLYCHNGNEGKIYQPTYLGERDDSDLTDCTTSQLVYKAED